MFSCLFNMQKVRNWQVGMKDKRWLKSVSRRAGTAASIRHGSRFSIWYHPFFFSSIIQDWIAQQRNYLLIASNPPVQIQFILAFLNPSLQLVWWRYKWCNLNCPVSRQYKKKSFDGLVSSDQGFPNSYRTSVEDSDLNPHFGANPRYSESNPIGDSLKHRSFKLATSSRMVVAEMKSYSQKSSRKRKVWDIEREHNLLRADA
jgi:hypothetical protein